jgi:hypothetical protein
MKALVLALSLTCCAVVGAGDPVLPTPSRANPTDHGPNCGFIADEKMATEVAKTVIRLLLSPEELRHKTSFNAVLKDGVWSVAINEPNLRMHGLIIIQIRQKTGAIIKYEDLNV